MQTYLQSALQAVNTQLIVGDKLTDSQIAAMYAPVTITTQELSQGGAQAGKRLNRRPQRSTMLLYTSC